ncbi:S8 family peptidase [Chryseobacterium sp. CH21]|uniref:S8 family peptidase n=1 Tax=Chryseobacterium sp. CH21 TaxID=713556 RepID=UPI001E3B90DA|nr:S8 family peptidase [Chryseobacterium sp. CH21]
MKREFYRQNTENNEKFDAYVAKLYGTERNPVDLKKIEEQRANLAGFLPNGSPYFHQSEDIKQIKNSNSDFLQNGTIVGLTGSFNGENIKFTVFDGGRIFGGHTLFDNAPNRITNMEANTMNYSAHATSVAGFIGAKSANLSGGGNNYNPKGIAMNSTMDSYSFQTTTLPGNANTSTVFQKILTAQPKISNHSYGSNQGWTDNDPNQLNAYVWNGNYEAGGNNIYDLQGTYFTNDKNYDQIVYNNPSYIIVKSSGNYFAMGPNNGGNTPKYYKNFSVTPIQYVQFTANDVNIPPNNCSLGYDCIGPGSLAKNIIVVGANNIITTNDERYIAPGDVVHSDYSSAGPRDDGGIKPDIVTVGTNVASASTAQDTTGSNTYTVGSGTSYSAPVVTGIIGLWTQINKQLFNNAELNAASAKVLTIHSASEAGNVGPDPWYGWGFINAKKGAELLVAKSNNTVIFKDEILNSGTANSKTVTASGSEPLKVTISWIDPEYNYANPDNLAVADIYNNRTSKLVNDLDLRIIDTTDNTIYYPWKLNANSPMTPATKADNTVDNVEQVVIDAPVAGRNYRIEITNKGNLVNNAGVNAPQNYSIMVSGHSNEVLATQETKAAATITIAPTLTKDIVKILNAPRKAAFTVYDLSGKKLQGGATKGGIESLDLSAFPKGIYIIEVKTEKETVSKRVIKE